MIFFRWSSRADHCRLTLHSTARGVGGGRERNRSGEGWETGSEVERERGVEELRVEKSAQRQREGEGRISRISVGQPPDPFNPRHSCIDSVEMRHNILCAHM